MEQKRDTRSISRSDAVCFIKMKTVTEKRYGEYHEDDRSVTLRNSGATYGGERGTYSIKTQSERYARETTRESAVSMSESRSS